MLPPRTTRLRTSEASELAGVQAERGREYVRTTPGPFAGDLDEWSDGLVAFLRERWSAPLRVRCARPRDYVAFSAVFTESDARWCGVKLGRESVLEVDRDWEITTRGALESFSFAVERGVLERVEGLLSGDGPGPPPRENRVQLAPAATQVAQTLRRRVTSALALGALPVPAARVLQAEFAHAAASLRHGNRELREHAESFARRRRHVRLVEEYLDAHERELPSLADLCGLTGASERTLEYAFYEQTGFAPHRYLRMRRLNGARNELLTGDREKSRVTDVALRWGFWHLGRFAASYELLFGERPSGTLSARRGRRDRSSDPGGRPLARP